MIRSLIFTLLLLIVLVPGSYAGNYYSPPAIEQKVVHPGNLDLVYLDWFERQPPLATLRKVRAHYKFFYAFPQVVTPSIQSIYLLEHTKIRLGEKVLDIGSGTGIQAIFAAEKASKVVATDLSHAAVENTRFNVEGHQLTHKVDSRQGDLFGPIKDDEKFDVIIFNISYPYDEKTQGLWKVHERFFKQVKNYLLPGGRIYYQAGWIFNIPRIFSIVQANDLRIMKMNMASALPHNREPIVFVIIPDPLKVEIPK